MTPEEQAQHDADVEKQLRDLATQIAAMTKLPFDPMTIRKAVVAAVADMTSPPTVSLNISGDTDTLVTQVRTLNNYTPLVGQTVLIAKQGAEIFILGSIASTNPKSANASEETGNGWTKASLSNGSHGGGDNDVYYRRILDHGSWKMQWRGVWNPGGASTMLNSGSLDSNYRPASYRAISLARNSDGAVNVRMDFNADGGVVILTGTPGISSTTMGGSTSSVGDLGGGAYSAGSHQHLQAAGDFYTYSAGSHSHSTYTGGHSHSISTNAHSHGGAVVIGYPGWISLNGVEYFL